MKALVAVKRVVGYNVKVRAKADGTDVDLNNVKMAMNASEIAVEEAVQKEAGTVTEIVAVSVAKVAVRSRSAPLCWADRGIHVEVDGKPEPLAIAKLKGVANKRIPTS